MENATALPADPSWRFTEGLGANDAVSIADYPLDAAGEVVFAGSLVTGIGGHVLTGCRSVTSLIIPTSITSIADSMFRRGGVLGVAGDLHLQVDQPASMSMTERLSL